MMCKKRRSDQRSLSQSKFPSPSVDGRLMNRCNCFVKQKRKKESKRLDLVEQDEDIVIDQKMREIECRAGAGSQGSQSVILPIFLRILHIFA